MGKKAFQIKFDKNTLGNVVKNGMLGLAPSLFGIGGGGGGPRMDPNARVNQDEIDKRVAESRKFSTDLMNQLSQQAAGKAPSLAQAQLKSTMDKSLAQQMAAAAAARGSNPALAQRLMMQQQGQAARDIAQQGAMARLQEQQNAQQQLSNLALQQQAADLGQIIQPAQINAGIATTQYQGDVAKDAANKQQQSAILGGLLGAGSQLGAAAIAPAAAMSDKNNKKDIKDAKKPFLQALSAKTYEYKDTKKPGTAGGQRFGIMAQDLEKSEMGKSLVKDTPHGKMVDTVQGFGAVLAAQAELNKRLEALEKRKKS